MYLREFGLSWRDGVLRSLDSWSRYMPYRFLRIWFTLIMGAVVVAETKSLCHQFVTVHFLYQGSYGHTAWCSLDIEWQWEVLPRLRNTRADWIIFFSSSAMCKTVSLFRKLQFCIDHGSRMRANGQGREWRLYTMATSRTVTFFFS